MRLFPNLFTILSWLAAVLFLAGCANRSVAIDAHANGAGDAISPFHPKAGRLRPLVAVVGNNLSTELSDYVVPFGILARADVADVMALSTLPGPIRTVTDMGKPSFQIQAEATIAQFDARFPGGADYIVVPATADSAALRGWILAQAAKGATVVSICNGALVVANTGAMQGRHATAHWSSEQDRLKQYPGIAWVKNKRYVVDGNWVSSAGVSAAMPTALALVEAIAGQPRAAALALELGTGDWRARHTSDDFQPQWGVNLLALGRTVYTNGYLHRNDAIGVPVAPGVDEVALALTVDAWSSTGRSQAFVVAAAPGPLRTRHGLVLIPDRLAGAPGDLGRMLPALDTTAPGLVLDQALAGIAAQYGAANAYGVALLLEYPGWRE